MRGLFWRIFVQKHFRGEAFFGNFSSKTQARRGLFCEFWGLLGNFGSKPLAERGFFWSFWFKNTDGERSFFGNFGSKTQAGRGVFLGISVQKYKQGEAFFVKFYPS